MNNDGSVHFDNQEPLPKKIETTYLGNEINREAILARNFEQNARSKKDLVQISAILEATNANLKWLLLIFDAVIKSKIIYMVWRLLISHKP